MSEDHYYISANCYNCGYYVDILLIPKGVTIRDFLTSKECPRCGCKDLTNCAPKSDVQEAKSLLGTNSIPVPENWRKR